MAIKRCEAFGLIAIMVMFSAMLSGEATECRNAIVSLSPCINYVCGNVSTPSYSCCSQLANVVKSQPRCLCALVSGGHGQSSMGFKINQTLALGLPAACSVHTPPVSRCDGNGTQTVPTPTPTAPTKSEGTTIYLPFYFSFASFVVAISMYV